MKTIYSLYLARYLIDNGFRCLKIIPHPHKPWMNAFQFEQSSELESAISKYLKEDKKNYDSNSSIS